MNHLMKLIDSIRLTVKEITPVSVKDEDRINESLEGLVTAYHTAADQQTVISLFDAKCESQWNTIDELIKEGQHITDIADQLTQMVNDQIAINDRLTMEKKIVQDKFDMLNGIMLAMLAGAPVEPLIRRYQVIFGR